MIRHKEYGSNDNWLNTTNRETETYFTIDNLRPFTRYEVEVAGVTEAGVGKFSWMQCLTAEDGELS